MALQPERRRQRSRGCRFILSSATLSAGTLAAGCLPPLIAPTTLAPRERAFNVGLGARGEGPRPWDANVPGDNTLVRPVGHAAYHERRTMGAGVLDLGAIAAVGGGNDRAPLGALGGFGRFGWRGTHYYLGGQLDLGPVYAGLGPVVAFGGGPLWVFLGARSIVSAPLPEISLSASDPSPPIGYFVGTVGTSISLGKAFNLQLVVDIDRDTSRGDYCHGWCGRAELALEYRFRTRISGPAETAGSTQ